MAKDVLPKLTTGATSSVLDKIERKIQVGEVATEAVKRETKKKQEGEFMMHL